MGHRISTVILFLSAMVCAQAAQLFPGVSRTLTIDALDEPTLITGLTVDAPPGTAWLVIDLAPDSASHDIDLYVRFAQPVEKTTTSFVADHSSTTVGGGSEHIFIRDSSNPPLQTGIYHVGLFVKTVGEPVRVTVRASIDSSAPLSTFLSSTFENGNDEGWTRNFPVSTIPGASLGNSESQLSVNDDGFLVLFERDGNAQLPDFVSRDFAVAGPRFLGDLSGPAEPRFEYDYRHHAGPTPLFRSEVRILGAESGYAFMGDVPKAGNWVHQIVPLEAAEWTRFFGIASFEEVLRRLTRVEVSMDHAPGDETAMIDNFSYIGEPPEVPSGTPSPTSSTFEHGLDGWTRNYPHVGIRAARNGEENAALAIGLGGKDSENFMLMVDGDGFDRDFALAPAKFLGDLSKLNRPWIEFYHRRIDGPFPFFMMKLRIVGAGTAYERSGARPRDSWERFQTALAPEFWQRIDGEASFQEVLSAVERFEVSMDLAEGPEVTGLDSFQLHENFVAPNGRALQIDRNRIEIEVPAGAEPFFSEKIEITASNGTMQWAAFVTGGGPWLALPTLTGSTPATFEVQIDPTVVPPGLYEAQIEFRPTIFSNPRPSVMVSLLVGGDPRVPRLSQGGVIHAADAQVAVSAGALASAYGRNLAAAEQALGFEPETGRLPTAAQNLEMRVYGDAPAAAGRVEQTGFVAAPLLYVGPNQVNFQMPFDVEGMSAVWIAAARDGIESERQMVSLAPASPGIFVGGNGLAAVLNDDAALNSPASAAAGGSIVTVFFSGLGPVAPQIPSGAPTPFTPLHLPTSSFSAQVGGQNAPVVGVAMTPGFVGLAQMSLIVPEGLTPGQVSFQITVAGRASNGVLVEVR
jgi:uncharacterized protein (TIGR03437 family)